MKSGLNSGNSWDGFWRSDEIGSKLVRLLFFGFTQIGWYGHGETATTCHWFWSRYQVLPDACKRLMVFIRHGVLGIPPDWLSRMDILSAG